MDPRYRGILLLTIVAVSIVLIYYAHWTDREDFASKKTKAQVIHDWFQANPAPNYLDYRRDLGGASNIVEYEDVLSLFQNRNLTVDSVAKAI